MSSMKSIAAVVDRVARTSPARLALTSPFQKGTTQLSYQALSEQTTALASWLRGYGFEQGDLLVSDLPNIRENLMLQIACNRLGVGYGTAKNIEGMSKFSKVKGAVSATGQGFLADTGLSLPCLTGDFVLDLVENGLDISSVEDFEDAPTDETRGHGFYNSPTAYTNKQALLHGQEAARELNMTENDVVCVAITLCHPFGIGSAVCAALQSGAAIALPAVGGIQGCGVPSERAAATLDVLQSEGCTLMFADTHTLKALPPAPRGLVLRGGVCKTGSGATFLEETREYGGVQLRTVGKKES